MQQRLQTLETAESQENDPAKRREIGDELKAFKLATEQSEKSFEQLQTREGELAGHLQSEQSRLTELNDRLDQIERALSVQ